MRPAALRLVLLVVSFPLVLVALDGAASFLVPTEVQLPGTQPNEVSVIQGVGQCDNCHAGYDPQVEPAFNWSGSPMAQAARDPVFWATVAVAEQDFPGAGDLCIRCHAVRGWLEGRSTPTDGSALGSGDTDGVECAICHQMTDPDGLEHVGVQNPPFVANDGGTPPEGWYGSGMLVMWPGNERLGPYANAGTAPHGFLQSEFHRSSDFCGSCHDVSNPVTGDLAHNNGAALPLAPGTFSGVPGTPVQQKAAFNNPPYAYGTVERTYSEHMASLFPVTRVSGYAGLPQDLRQGAVQFAWQAALGAGTGGDYADGTPRYFTCQSCHTPPVTGKGCDRNNAPVRTDLPLHDLTGGNYWLSEVVQHMDGQGTLVTGGGLGPTQVAALDAGAQRARTQLDRAASLTVQGNTVRVLNLTGHKLITGFPEGRRMWLSVRWSDAQGQVLREDGEYGPVTVTIGGQSVQVDTILAPADPHTHVWEAKPGITSEWALQLLGLGLPPALPLAYDRVTGAPVLTLVQLAGMPPGTARETFHFVLNDTFVKDTRIPPWGMSYDEARVRNCLPVPESLFGDPGPGGTYDHWDDVVLSPPPGAASATIELLYQPTSWEYVQFLHLANDGTSARLGTSGTDLLDAWLATGMAAPHVMASAVWTPSVTATATVLGTGCGGAGTPSLALPPPVLGTTVTLSVTGATPGASGLLLASPPPPAPLPLGGGCTVQVDLATAFELLPVVVDGNGAWTFALPLPADPSLAGLDVVLQAALLSTGGPLGVDMTNGVEVVLGY